MVRVRALLGPALIVLGLLQAFGFALRLKPLEELGFVTMSSPLPLVFTDRNGMEDFAMHHDVRWVTRSGATKQRRLTGAELRTLGGPFARRATYAAAIAYSPRLPDSLWRNALRHGFCKTRVLATALNEAEPIARVTLELSTRTRGRPKRWQVGIRCDA